VSENVQWHQGSTPLLISMPHNATRLPEQVATGMTEAGRAVTYTDWYVDRLYDFAEALGASLLKPIYSRYLIDLNRPIDDSQLYPGQDTSALCPLYGFDGEPLYPPGQAPSTAEIQVRINRYWQPWHEQLATALETLRERHGYALLLDAHTIPSQLPRLFAGTLPDFNLGTHDGRSCDRALMHALQASLGHFPGYSQVTDGRFKGGFITRHYGQPHRQIHAVQLELSQATYLTERRPGEWDETKAEQVKPALRAFVDTLLAWGRSTYG